jgi:hypothetical protein
MKIKGMADIITAIPYRNQRATNDPIGTARPSLISLTLITTSD